MISLVFAAALFAAGEPAAAQPASTAAPPAKAVKVNKDGLVCRKEAVAGSRMKSRICMTQAEWDDRQRQDREMVEKAQSLKPLNSN
jgi:hypothetical protein